MNRILSSKWTLVVALILLALLVRGNLRILKNYYHVKDKYNADLKVYEELKVRDAELTKDIERIKTEDGMDYEIRRKLDVSRDDEKVIKIIDKR